MVYAWDVNGYNNNRKGQEIMNTYLSIPRTSGISILRDQKCWKEKSIIYLCVFFLHAIKYCNTHMQEYKEKYANLLYECLIGQVATTLKKL